MSRIEEKPGGTGIPIEPSHGESKHGRGCNQDDSGTGGYPRTGQPVARLSFGDLPRVVRSVSDESMLARGETGLFLIAMDINLLDSIYFLRLYSSLVT